ncbi:2-iminoacetate synthase ThiH [Salipaludibacillus agaradhaerens]|nr:2-iminoacetate synthase ThiH [Salipaludibacillus agaradhaerens]MCR6106238.1 2-iminoacetate synthase ThiH [Salipaludibacillus agaradhaerens]MCR6118271.1 2-iminoacetate synthase ThiH [Salipaludibacillus agaradhaerens]UJW57381.1 2-iminoacetate synthase ThiH [Bacillus sp. A116_S68]
MALKKTGERRHIVSFYDKLQHLKGLPIADHLASISPSEIETILTKSRIDEHDFLKLLSPAAETYLEVMAQKAHQLTVQHFGKTMLLFQPLYLSDYCVNICKYCSFSVDNSFPRRRLTMDEVRKEAEIISDRGIQHIILLSGESRNHSSVAYLIESMSILKDYFASISIEIQPMDTLDYQKLVKAGIDGVTVYQEVYDEKVYSEIHTAGPKRDFRYRLQTPERAAAAGMRTVNIGALLGLDEWRKECFITGLHAAYLQQTFPETEVSVSFPRLRPHAGSYKPKVMITDKHLVQAIVAARLFLPRAGITLSTRERATLRNNLIPLGVTKMSAESSTVVGGYSEPDVTQSQFDISDERSVKEVKEHLQQANYSPVMKDWQFI